MTDPKMTYFLDKLGLGNESNDIEIDREALHGQEVSPQVATVLLLQQIERHLSDISTVIHEMK
jgi:hypothetical protein